jgi:predicted AlkP superfamily pyrophosphatase or phosphodiesterase
MYSPDLSLFVLDAGIKLVEDDRADLLYLSLSDLVQHAYGPGEEPADAFHRAVDRRVGRLAEVGAVVGLVADYGMTDNSLADGSPKFVFLEDELNRRFGAGRSQPTSIFNGRIDYSTADGWPLQLDLLNLFNSKANQISYAYGSLIRTDSLYNLCFPVQAAPAAVCQNGLMDTVLHPIEPLTIRVTLAGAF